MVIFFPLAQDDAEKVFSRVLTAFDCAVGCLWIFAAYFHAGQPWCAPNPEPRHPCRIDRIFVEVMTSDRKLKASREGEKVFPRVLAAFDCVVGYPWLLAAYFHAGTPWCANPEPRNPSQMSKTLQLRVE